MLHGATALVAAAVRVCQQAYTSNPAILHNLPAMHAVHAFKLMALALQHNHAIICVHVYLQWLFGVQLQRIMRPSTLTSLPYPLQLASTQSLYPTLALAGTAVALVTNQVNGGACLQHLDVSSQLVLGVRVHPRRRREAYDFGRDIHAHSFTRASCSACTAVDDTWSHAHSQCYAACGCLSVPLDERAPHNLATPKNCCCLL